MVDLVRPSGLSVVAAITCNTVRTLNKLDPVDLDLMDLYPNSKLPSNRQAVMNLRGCRRVLLDRGPSVVGGVGLGLGGHRLLKVSIQNDMLGCLN